jgi:hypothetical protein
MQGSAWVELIKRIPPAHHDNLVAVTSTGAEIMVQRIMRLEDDFVILRGRPTGSTEQGRVLLLPWDQLNHLAFHKALPETEIQKIFGNGDAGEEAPQAVAVMAPEQPAASAGNVPMQEAESEGAKPAPAQTAPPAANKPAPLSKSILLARLRARMANEISKG